MPLIDSDNWKAAFRSLNQLRFHPANPRLPELPPNASERDIIKELALREDVETVARSIADKGYFRNDRLVVLVEGAKHIVYEGNRRLCALKLLARPDKAPPSKVKLFTKLAERARLPKKIAIEIVPSRYDAEVVMFSKHAMDKFTRQWKPLQKAAFVASKMEQGEDIDDIASGAGLKREEVISARAAMDLYRIARAAPLSKAAQALVDDPANFPYSIVFERIFFPKECRKLLGVHFSDKGLVVNSSPEMFKRLLSQILEDVALDEEGVNTRSLNSVSEAVDYIKSLDYSLDGGKTTVDDVETGAAEEEKGEPDSKVSAKSPPKQKSATSKGKLFPRDLVSDQGSEKVDLLIEEGKKMPVAALPHSAALLLRSVLEISLTTWLKRNKLYHAVPASNSKHGPSLADMLSYINKNPTSMNLDAQEKGALAALVSKAVKESKFQLDRITHSNTVTTHGAEVESLREQALPLLRKALAK